MKRRGRFLGVSMVLVCLMLLAACSGSQSPAPASNAPAAAPETKAPPKEPDKVRLRLSYLVFATHIPYVVADQKGYFKENNIQVELLKGQGSSFAVQVVGAKKEEFGHAAAPSILTAVAQGVPVVSVADLYTTSHMALFATEKSGIKEPKDLKGHTVGLFVGSTTEIMTRALLKKYGLTDKDVQTVTVKAGGDLPLVTEGKIEAEISYFTNELAAWKISNPDLKLKIWRLDELGFDVPGEELIVHKDLLKENPDLVRRFVDATMKGARYAKENPAEAVDLLVKAFPELNKEQETAKWKEMAGIVNTSGQHPEAKWKALHDLMVEYKVIEKALNLSDAYTNQYLTK